MLFIAKHLLGIARSVAIETPRYAGYTSRAAALPFRWLANGTAKPTIVDTEVAVYIISGA
jgi:hypothetical protein